MVDSQQQPGSASLGVFSRIRTREDALRVVRGAAITFYLAAAVLAWLAWQRGWQDLVDAGLYVVLGSLMWRFRSPVAAVTLLLVALMRMFVTIGMSIETGQVIWSYAGITVVVLFASIRAIEATLKIHGRFAGQS